MRRLVPGAIVLLVLAVVFNIAVAWRIAATAEIRDLAPGEPKPAVNWPRAVPSDWPKPDVIIKGRGEGLLWMGGLSATSWRTSADPMCDVTIMATGWPAPAMSWERWSDFRKFKGHAGAVKVGPDSTWAGGLPSEEPWRAVPLRPVWLGFAVNTVFYAGVGAMAVAGIVYVRRRKGTVGEAGSETST